MLECVINVSEGRRAAVIEQLGAAAGDTLLDLHVDGDHHRSVLTLAGAGVEEAARAVAAVAVAAIDLRDHEGAHPRLGAVDVVPFVPLATTPLDDALEARDRFANWAAAELGVPCFLFGPERSLPDVRRRAFADLAPDVGPSTPHPRAGAMCVGGRGPLVAYNLWLDEGTALSAAQRVAAALRSPRVRALGLAVGAGVQVSTNLLDPLAYGPADAYDAVAAQVNVAGAELVGLVPAAVLERTAADRWEQLDLGPDRTIEARLEANRARAQGGSG